MSFPELLISKCWEFLAKIAIRVSLGEKNSYGFQSWGNTHKKHIFHTCVFPSTMVMRAGNTIAFSCHFVVFMRIHMCVPDCLWKHIPNVEIVEHRVYRCGNTCLTHTRLQSLFLSLRGNTYVFTCSGSIKYLETHARISWFSSLNNRKHHGGFHAKLLSSSAMPPGILMNEKLYHKGRPKQLSLLTSLLFLISAI